MIILDTNVVSEIMRPAPQPAVVSWVDLQDAATLFLTTITLAEIRDGIAALPKGRRRVALDEAFERSIRPLFSDRILTFDEAATREYADLRATARSRGLTIPDLDAMIAAIARSHDFPIASRDVVPFEAAGVRVIDPSAVG